MKEDDSIETRVQQAMRSRVQHFRDLADSLSFEKVRRLLEEDLGLDTHALDKHKKFVKQLLEKLLNGTEDDMASEQIKLENVKKDEEEEEKPEEQKTTDIDDEEKPKEQKVTDNNDEEKIEEDSPVMGLLSGNKSSKSKNPKTLKTKIPTEDMVKKAIWKRANHFRSKSEELTVASVRRLIEEDLGLEKFSIDPFKKLISKQLDEVLNSENDAPNKSDASESEEEVKPKKKSAPKTKVQKSEVPKKRKKITQETEQPKKKKMKNIEETSVKKKNVKDADVDDSGEKSDLSADKSEKKEVVAPVYGKKVERLKSVIKACGMTVAPTVYRKAKQVSEDKREEFLVKELKEILSKEGLSSNPSEKEIKEVKRRKEKAKELEGIDTSNIVTGSRRRSTFNFVAPPKPKAPIEVDGDESEESDDDEGDDDSEDTDIENGDGDKEVDDEEGGDDEEDGDDKKGDDQEGDDDDKDGNDDDVKDDESKSEEVTVNDEIE